MKTLKEDDVTNKNAANLSAGFYYNEEGKFDKEIEGTTKTYLKRSNGDIKDLNITHHDFCYVCYVVLHEVRMTDIEELKGVAFASYNSFKAGERGAKTWKELLETGYSSVDPKKPLGTDKNEKKDKLARKAVISVLLGETDITNGAKRFDGTDFLMVGTDEPKPKGDIGHNKFKEYKFIKIPKAIYDAYRESNKLSERTEEEKRHKGSCTGSHRHETEGKKNYIRYYPPASVFSDKNNWKTGDFYYKTNIETSYGLVATLAAGESIFWKLEE